MFGLGGGGNGKINVLQWIGIAVAGAIVYTFIAPKLSKPAAAAAPMAPAAAGSPMSPMAGAYGDEMFSGYTWSQDPLEGIFPEGFRMTVG